MPRLGKTKNAMTRLAVYKYNSAWSRLEKALANGSAESEKKAKIDVVRAEKLISAANSGMTLRRWLSDSINAGGWSKSAKRAAKVALFAVLVAAVGLGIAALVRMEPDKAQSASGTDSAAVSETSVKNAAEQCFLGIKISGNPVKVRMAPSREASEISEVYSSDNRLYELISEESDSDGNLWFQIALDENQSGWVTAQYSKKLYETPDGRDEIINRTARKYDAVGAQAVLIKNGAIVGSYAYGWAEIGEKAMTQDTKLRTASLSAIPLTMCAMLLSEESALDIDEDVGKYWGFEIRNPAFPDTPITLKGWLTSTSSMVYHAYSEYDYAKTADALKSAKGYDSEKEPGAASSWAENSFATGAAGSTMELAINGSLLGFSENKLFGRLGMDASFASGRISDKSFAALYKADHTLARSTQELADRTGSLEPAQSVYLWAGGLTASAYDVAKLICVLINDGSYEGKAILGSKSVAEMEKKRFSATEYGTEFIQCMPMRYAENLCGQSRLYYQTGNAYGVLSLAAYNPDTGDGVVVITTGAQAVRTENGIYSVCFDMMSYLLQQRLN